LKWKKIGLIFEPKQQFPWLQTHASVPVVDKIDDEIYRIYFSGRDLSNHSSIGWIEINIKNPQKILKISEQPILSPGNTGNFDDSGVMATSLVNVNEKKFLYYVGWNQRKSVPFHWSIGLAISTDLGKNFIKFSEGPIMERNHIDPYFVSSPTVIKENKIWKMWYISGLGWKKSDNKLIIPYNVRYAESLDGINWKRNREFCMNFKDSGQTRIGRVSILKEDKKYKIWYSHAGKSYRIGYAESLDGMNWERKDELTGIDVSKTGWDSEMIEYSCVFKHKEKKYMLYNGNNYGKTGIGLAIME
jgi:predicted GH43/DUF377 family glycosyl hydrolase